MNNDKNIGSYGAVSFVLSMVSAKVFITAPSYYAKQSASAGWLEVLLSGIFEFLILAVILKLLERYEGMDLIDIAQNSFGKTGGVIVGVLSSAVFLSAAATGFRCFEEMMRSCIIKPISYDYVSVFLIAAVVIAAYLGLGTQVSLNGLIVPFMGIFVIIMLLVISPHYSISNICPYFGNGIANTASNAVLKNSSYYELGTLLYIIPYLGKKKSVKKIAFTTIGASILVFSLITLCYQLAVPYEAAGTFAMPMYQMTRMLRAGSFMKRLEPLLVFVWSGSLYIYIGAGIWFAANSFKKAFSLRESKTMVFIFCAIVCFAALIPKSEASVEKILNFILRNAYVAYPLMPLILLITARAVKKMAGEGSK
jgi:spore germination protein (amino acid permease)